MFKCSQPDSCLKKKKKEVNAWTDVDFKATAVMGPLCRNRFGRMADEGQAGGFRRNTRSPSVVFL